MSHSVPGTQYPRTIGVIGSGIMGSGIAQVCAMSGFQVWLYDINEDQLKKARGSIERSLSKLASKNKISDENKSGALQNLKMTSRFEDLKEADFCIEAASEKVDLKKSLFNELDRLVRKDVILASNTSSIPITELAGSTRRPEKVIGMHFMNPVPLMECVEVILGEKTSDATLQTTLELVRKLGKKSVTAKDSPGFLINRILIPMLGEAIRALEEGLASREDIDLAFESGCNFPMGPLKLADFVGLDTALSIMEIMHRGLKDEKFKPPLLLKKYVGEGKFGRKSGEGFYKYE